MPLTYTYDSLNRVTSVDYGGGNTESCTYDPAGNRMSMDVSAVDSDGDGIPDSPDNCMSTQNQSQQDTDNAGYGNACDADLDNDGFVGPNDFTVFGAAWWTDSSSGNWNPAADFDSDGFVGPNDYTIFGSKWWTSGPWQ